jgi:archaellum component FlaC
MSKPQKNKVASEEFVWKIYDDINNKVDELRVDMDGKFEIMNSKFDKMMEHIVDIAGKFNKFDESQEIISHRTHENTDRIKKLEKAVFKSS